MSRRVSKTQIDGQKGVSEVATRDQLLIAAGDLMTERGSTDVSLSEIAAKSGLNSALVKYYFGSKSGLQIELLRRALGPGMEQLSHLASAPLSPPDKLRIHISGMVNSYFRFPYVNHLMHQMLADNPTIYGPIISEEFGKPVADAQRQILEDGFNQGYFRPIDPLLFYFNVTGACDQFFYGRYQLQHIFGVSKIDEVLKKKYVDHVVGLLLHGVTLNPTDAR